MPDIFDEVQDDLRAERTRALLRRYGIWAVGALVLVLIGVGAWQGWRAIEARRTGGEAAAYIAAMDDADAGSGVSDNARRVAAADRFLAVAARARIGYATLARLRAAALLADAGQLDRAAAIWDTVADGGAVDPTLRDLADLMWIDHEMDHADPKAVSARIDRLTAPGNAWRPLAEEQRALLELRQGHDQSARDVLTRLSADPASPPGLRERATVLLAGLPPAPPPPPAAPAKPAATGG